jgi:phenylpropionate dioxygenase-like ring-hydroxylating dioxygenase large terminal subunit
MSSATRGQLTDEVMRVPVERYLSTSQWQREIDEMFLKVPLFACLSVDIPNAGDYAPGS